MKSKLSIITINYNNCLGLSRTIKSVLAQTFKDLEYIIIDGGSNDDSIDVIKSHQDSIDYWVSEPDKGIYNAMNKGIKKASGEYLQFLNSGDTFVDNTVLSTVFSKPRTADIVYGDLFYVYGDDSKKVLPSLYGGQLTMVHFFHRNLGHPAAFIKKSLFSDSLYDEKYRFLADNKFFIESIILKNCSVEYLGKVLIDFDMSGVSSESTNWACINEERAKLMREVLPPRIHQDYEILLKVIDSPLLPYFETLNETTGFHQLVSKVVGLMVKAYRFIKLGQRQ